MVAKLEHVLVARRRRLTAALYRCGLPGMALLWVLLKCLPITWLFKLTIK